MLTGHRSGLSGSQKDGEKDNSLKLVRETLKDFLVSCFAFPVKQTFLLQSNKEWTFTLKAQGSCFRLQSRVSNLTQFFCAAGFSVLVARDRPSENEQALNQKLVWLLGVKLEDCEAQQTCLELWRCCWFIILITHQLLVITP